MGTIDEQIRLTEQGIQSCHRRIRDLEFALSHREMPDGERFFKEQSLRVTNEILEMNINLLADWRKLKDMGVAA